MTEVSYISWVALQLDRGSLHACHAKASFMHACVTSGALATLATYVSVQNYRGSFEPSCVKVEFIISAEILHLTSEKNILTCYNIASSTL